MLKKFNFVIGIVAVVLLIAGVAVFLAYFPFNDVSAETLIKKEKRYDVDYNETIELGAKESLGKIDINMIAAFDLEIKNFPAEEIAQNADKARLEVKGFYYKFFKNRNISFEDEIEFIVKNDALKVTLSIDDGHNFWGSFGDIKATLYIPEGYETDLSLLVNAGSVKMDIENTVVDTKIRINAGSFKGNIVAENLEVRVNAGSFSGNIEAKNVDINVNAGSFGGDVIAESLEAYIRSGSFSATAEVDRYDLKTSAGSSELTLKKFVSGSVSCSAGNTTLRLPQVENYSFVLKISAGYVKDDYMTNRTYRSNITLNHTNQHDYITNITVGAGSVQIKKTST